VNDAKTPCSAKPDQWYTERDGRRYDDESLLTESQIRDLTESVGSMYPDYSPSAVMEEVESAVDEATAEATRVRLVERRQARDACFGCEVRLQCLDLALKNREQYGIWGGYFPEQRRAIERALDERLEAAAKKRETSEE